MTRLQRTLFTVSCIAAFILGWLLAELAWGPEHPVAETCSPNASPTSMRTCP